MLEISLNLVIHKDIICNNINKYCYYKEEHYNNKLNNKIDKDYKLNNNKIDNNKIDNNKIDNNKIDNKISKNNKVWLKESVA